MLRSMTAGVAGRSRVGRTVVRIAALAALGLVSSAYGQVITGFGGSSETGWTPNADAAATTAGVPSVSGTGNSADVLTLTTAANSEATSYWFNTPQDVTNFLAQFTYTDVSGGGADGIVFALQNSGTNALGGGGGSLGYGGITSAVGDCFNIYSGNSGSATQFNGSITGGPALTPTKPMVDITSKHPINVTLSYRQQDNAMVETLQDTVTNGTLTKVYRSIDIAGAVGGNSALVGFTGGTGGVNANQTISNFSFTTGAAGAAPVAAFQPISATGYNQNMVVSLASGATNVTATLDGGTAKTGNTFYERGVNTGANGTGLPAAGTIFGSGNDANHVFAFQPYSGNNAVMLDTAQTTGTLTLTDPKAYQALSFLVTDGNGSTTFTATIHFADGASDEVHSGIAAPDWFNNTPNIAFDANGRETLAGAFGNASSGNPRLYQEDLTLADTSDPISSIDFTFGGSGNNRTAIFGISGVVPEPGCVGLICVAGLALARRRKV